MFRDPSFSELPRFQRWADRAFEGLTRLLHKEAASGVVLLITALAALAWANSPFADQYHAFWHTPLSIGVGVHVMSESLHFWVNEGLMTLFFLVVGMEIRREIHDGSLASLKLAALPLAAALGGIIVPALIYLTLNLDPVQRQGWAVPTATDIAFAVGVLALLGRSIPGPVRVFLLALAIIDDVVAVLIIALFYSGGLDFSGLAIAAAGILLVLGLQGIGVGSAYAYVLPGVVLWTGLLLTGAHPTLAGVVLGLMTPVALLRRHEPSLLTVTRTVDEFQRLSSTTDSPPQRRETLFGQMRSAQRELLAPVTRVRIALHPWVAFGIMPLFALANAGVGLEGVDLAAGGALHIFLGICLALALGKPLGVLLGTWLVVRFAGCPLPPGMDWRCVGLVGCLTGIGFTMSIFIAALAFADPDLLAAAKLGVLVASAMSAIVGLSYGHFHVAQRGSRQAEPGFPQQL